MIKGKKMEIGQYLPETREVNDWKGFRRVTVWVVRLEDDTEGNDVYFDCETQWEAEVLSRMVKKNIE